MDDEDALRQGLYPVSMAQVYPADRGTNYAVREGKRVAMALHRMAESTIKASCRTGARDGRRWQPLGQLP